MFIDESPISNNENIKKEIVGKFESLLIEKVQYNTQFAQFLVNMDTIHDKLLATLSIAIKINEDQEKYEVCSKLHDYKCEILATKIN